MELKIEIPDRRSNGVIALLESLLVDEYVLCVRTRDARRNINGRNIAQLRKLFAYHCIYLDSVVADLSRRVRTLGKLAPVTFAHSMKVTRLKRHDERLRGQNQIIEALLDDHESIIGSLSNDISGAADEKSQTGAADFMSDLLGRHMEMAGALKDLS